MRPRLIGVTTSRLTHGQPEEPSRAHGARRLRVSRICSGRRGLGGENGPIFFDISDCCETSSAAAKRWSRTRSEGGPSYTQAALHEEGCYRSRDLSRLDRVFSSEGRPCLCEENEPIFLDISERCEPSSATAEKWSRARSEAGRRRSQAATQAGRHRGRDRSRLDRGLASLVRPGLGGENEPTFLDLSDRCETSSAAREKWSRTRSKGGPRHTQATTHEDGRYRGRDLSRLDRGLASLVRPGLSGENEPTFLDISDCCETSSVAREKWSRTCSEGGPRRAQATHMECRYRMPAPSSLDRGLTRQGRPKLGGENGPIFLDISDCRETSSALRARWSRTRSDGCPRSCHARYNRVRWSTVGWPTGGG
jgi:hypothetical protein